MVKRASTPRAPLIYVDSDIYIDLVTKSEDRHPETNRPRWRHAKELFDVILEDRALLAASAWIEAEVGCNGQVRSKHARVKRHLDDLWQAEGTVHTDVDRFLVREAKKLSSEYALRGATPSIWQQRSDWKPSF